MCFAIHIKDLYNYFEFITVKNPVDDGIWMQNSRIHHEDVTLNELMKKRNMHVNTNIKAHSVHYTILYKQIRNACKHKHLHTNA